MGQALLSQDDRAGSLAALEKCLSIWNELPITDPQFPSFEHRLNFSQLAIELQAYDMAIELLEELLEEADDALLVHYYLGLAYHLNGDKEASQPFLRTTRSLLEEVCQGSDAGLENDYQDMLAHVMELLSQE